ncbi:hypothetical protein CDV36_011463 [Fusarium kuroshium]|uniref:Apple domain-containing protein n=1 Tax=Fusarium kuroshium TaxID=2010991 RepID=A0A3M2RVK6_9HYPO|nr:hypothetical protein CDV36_011463 [Fusarium kuroshium]
MASTRDAEGLQVDYHREAAASAPEAYNQHQYTAVAGKDGPYNPENQAAATPQQKVPFGLSVLSFGLLVALLTAVIVGGAVGGGLGGALASCKSSDSSESSTAVPTPTETSECSQSNSTDDDTVVGVDYAPLPAAQVANLTLNCPKNGANGTTRTTNGYKFSTYCGVNAPDTGDGNVNDIVSLWAYYFEDCMGACAEMTRNNDTICNSVFFRIGMNGSTTQYGNCWLKNGKLKAGDASWTTYGSGHVYAELEDDDDD